MFTTVLVTVLLLALALVTLDRIASRRRKAEDVRVTARAKMAAFHVATERTQMLDLAELRRAWEAE